jgi:hypothetical protein
VQLPFQCNDLILARTGTQCQWRYIPNDLPPKSMLFGYFDLGTGAARWIAFITRYVKCREALVDSQELLTRYRESDAGDYCR